MQWYYAEVPHDTYVWRERPATAMLYIQRECILVSVRFTKI